MRYAINDEGERIEVEYSGQKALCQICRTPVYGRRPEIAVDHWVHVSNSDCQGCNEPMTKWHRDWQDEFDIADREVRIGKHRADVCVRGFVVEFQHSTIRADDLKSREQTYKHMAWVIDITHENPDFANGEWTSSSSMLDRFRVLSNRPVFLDIGNAGVVYVHRMNPDRNGTGSSGTGTLFTRAEFIENVKSGWVKESAKPMFKPDKKKRKRSALSGGKHDWWNDGEACDRSTPSTSTLALSATAVTQAKTLRKEKPLCQCYSNKDVWIETACDDRPGWFRSACSICNRFLGYRVGQQGKDAAKS